MQQPQIYPVRKQAEIIFKVLQQRLDTILPAAMREAGLDMWIVLCQEDDYDPVFKTMVPMDTWAPILQMLIFFDPGPGQPIQRTSLSMTDTQGLYEQPWNGRDTAEQWSGLAEIVRQRQPRRIGVNTGSTQWAAGGLTHNLYQQLVQALGPELSQRMVSAEAACTRWLMTLTGAELELYQHVARIAHWIIAECFNRKSITPGETTTADLEWQYWQIASDLGLELSFKPFFRAMRSQAAQPAHPLGDPGIDSGALLHCDVGIRYLRINSDHQELAYVLKPGETGAPEGLKRLMGDANHLQRIFMGEFQHGLSGNQLLERILARARQENVPGPRIYSHSLGLFLHEPGPLIGLPWEQVNNPGRGAVRLEYDTCFTMELAVEDRLTEWGDQPLRLSVEQDVMFTRRGCQPIDGVQEQFHLI